ncbi:MULTISPECIES: (Fe-S)-binding protein [Thermodesulfobacterium]|uniref:4Fe-4S ferredoxin-type domain-containing protein n=2 Tax=Thermodesulfobacterium commune TaxID=1741 RepID=A0A075WUE6_9BACT|nr:MULTISPECIES: (Fe-S)-binding protein [Thermodesulfobacterium]KUK37794.1 MAG: Uncharacterized protein XD67_0911 [Thermodesulfobacterium commune]AIH04033.1 hypothetical protein HL41_04185 [Thermodesulfobacterium commune DSM 2178]MBZ4681409.1 hypothetical protein [Thermodesulfobacterium sp.]MDN5379534.1 glycolate oxidase iron-sulfur subunit [Thermodesulfobacterium sp.]HAA83957.1 (Fe-S)-binding protein [Thermodesulfobacterium commune]
MTSTVKNINANLCTRCGKCVPHCPTYRVFRSETYSPRGRLFFFQRGIYHQSLEACLFCGKCERVCPNRVGFVESGLEIIKDKKEPIILKEASDLIGGHPLQILSKLRFLDRFDKILPEKGKVNPKKIYSFKENQGKPDLLVYFSCDLKHLYPQVLEKFLSLLKKKGINVWVVEDSECCGAHFLSLGFPSLVKQRALKNLKVLQEVEAPVVFFCATCLWMFKKVYPKFFEGTSYEKDFLDLAKRGIFAYKALSLFGEEELKVLADRSKDSSVLFHLPCHLTEEFSLVKNKIKVSEFCCGSPKISLYWEGFPEKYKRVWIQNLVKVKVVATFCAGCFLNFNMVLSSPPQIKHWLELL